MNDTLLDAMLGVILGNEANQWLVPRVHRWKDSLLKKYFPAWRRGRLKVTVGSGAAGVPATVGATHTFGKIWRSAKGTEGLEEVHHPPAHVLTMPPPLLFSLKTRTWSSFSGREGPLWHTNAYPSALMMEKVIAHLVINHFVYLDNDGRVVTQNDPFVAMFSFAGDMVISWHPHYWPRGKGAKHMQVHRSPSLPPPFWKNN